MLFRLFLSIFLLLVRSSSEATECQDHESICDDQSTCCRLDSGEYGCCPMPRAVCCTDGVHCCPERTTCDLQTMQCLSGTTRVSPLELKTRKSSLGSSFKNVSSVPWSGKLMAKTDGNAGENSIICGDQKSKCPDETTCCKLSSGHWGCCPMPQAVCCSDGVHCCPENTICDLDQGRCVQSTTVDVDLDRSIFLALVKIHSSDLDLWSVTCDSDKKYKCPDWTTCCKLRTGRWGCCPMPQAVCCPDGVHCCPQDTSCDVEQGRCQRNEIRAHWRNVDSNAMSRISLKARPQQSLNDHKLCPDHKQTCPVDETCCLFNQTWSCCPFPEGVCCSNADPPYCCAKGQKCGSTSGQVCITPEI